MPAWPSSVSTTGSWKAMPKAKISVMISERYSLTLGSSSMPALVSARRLLHAERELHQHRHDEEDRPASRRARKKTGVATR